MSCSVSLTSFANETDNPELKLPLPEFEKIVIAGEDYLKTDIDGFKGVLRIYATYQTLGDLHLEFKSEIQNLELQVNSLEASVTDCNEVLTDSEKDRDFIYNLRQSDLKKADTAARRQKLRAILFGVGGGVVALAAGFLIGAFAL